FLVQAFQLKYGKTKPALRTPNTAEALEALRAAGLLSADEHAALRAGYDFLRLVQSRLRIVPNHALDELPDTPGEVEKPAGRLGFGTGERFEAELERHTRQTRELFLRLLEREQGRPV